MNRLLLIMTTLMVGLSMAATAPAGAEEMSLMAFNVGKADCLLLRSGKTAYLIDTARGKNSETIEKGLKALGVGHLDGVVITHMDSDHVGGLKKLLKSGVEVDHVYAPAFYLPEDSKDTENPAVKATAKQGLEVEFLKGGDELPLDGGVLRVIGPLRAATDKEDNNSLVLYAEAAGGSMLLAGDMEFPEEASLLDAGAVPRADVLKVGNHGDNDATSPALLSAVQPRFAVISTSTEEKESTPAKRTIQALRDWNVEILQTQEAEWGIRVTIRDGAISSERVQSMP
ncbi:MAG: MBL fold metallo-hydrolase [Clostridiales bacterium]|nr:MBL fold metallo-hydrolase [Clostridiales bacterium]